MNTVYLQVFPENGAKCDVTGCREQRAHEHLVEAGVCTGLGALHPVTHEPLDPPGAAAGGAGQ